MNYPTRTYSLEDIARDGEPYGCVVIDPPWTFQTWSEKGKNRSAENHYLCQSDQWLAELPIMALTRPDTAICTWAIDPKKEDAYALIREWGFIPTTVLFTWIKLTKNCPDDEYRFHMGMGYYTRKNPEQVIAAERAEMFETEEILLGRREMTPQRKSKAIRQTIFAPLREHSRKPDEIYAAIESIFDGPYIELFARDNPHRPDHWDCWGLELTGG